MVSIAENACWLAGKGFGCRKNTVKIAAVSLLYLLHSNVFAAESQTSAPANSPVGQAAGKGVAAVQSGQIVEIILALGAVLLLIVGAAWFVKRFSGLGPQGGQHIKTIAVMPVGTRERIAVVQIGERQIVVGITQSQITTLLELDQPLDTVQGNSEFARKLQSLLHRGENEAKGEANGTQKRA